MSLAVCEISGRHLPSMGSGCGGTAALSPAAPADVDSAFFPDQWLSRQEAAIREEATEQKDGQFDIWASIQSLKKEGGVADDPPAPYVHPLLRRSGSSLSQKSLEICTESLGSETGSEDTFSPDDLLGYCPTWRTEVDDKVAEEAAPPAEDDDITTRDGDETVEEYVERPPRSPPPPSRRNKLVDVNYHCSISRRSPARAFPPPLPSICRRDGPCLSMRRYRQDGRLVVEAVPAPSQNYLHAQRRGGRLVLTFIETTFQDIYPENEEEPGHEQMLQKLETEAQSVQAGAEEAAEARGRAPPLQGNADDDDADDDEEEAVEEEGEEVEVVDRGIVVEIKVSRPPLPQNGGLKVQRSSVVINKFVGMPPWPELRATAMTSPPPRQIPLGSNAATSATALVAVAVAASSSLSIDERYWRKDKGPSTSAAQQHPSPEKLYFTSKRLGNRQDLLHQVRRCSEHHRPLFIREPCCIATS